MNGAMIWSPSERDSRDISAREEQLKAIDTIEKQLAKYKQDTESLQREIKELRSKEPGERGDDWKKKGRCLEYDTGQFDQVYRRAMCQGKRGNVPKNGAYEGY
jgi:hypothetical protein